MDENLNCIESVSEGFPSYFYMYYGEIKISTRIHQVAIFNYDYVNLNYFVKIVSKVIKMQNRYISLSIMVTSG